LQRRFCDAALHLLCGSSNFGGSMSRWPVFSRILLLILTGIWIAGCTPISENDEDDRSNPEFLKGTRRLNEMDYKGAIDAFEKALLRNPRSAGAHWELGLLYEQKMNDYLTAAYHYQRHLQLRPNSNVAETVRARIASCRLELARTVSFSLVNQQVQAGLDRLNSENAALRQQVEHLKLQLAQSTNPGVVRPLTVVSNQSATRSNVVAAAPVILAPVVPSRTERVSPAPKIPSESPRATTRTHVVRAGETAFRIGQKYGFKAEEILAANPGLVAAKLRAGQTINIPAPRN
jgi:LysM repeat protein